MPGGIRDELFRPLHRQACDWGTGLVLSITLDIVTKAHGGTISADSEVDDDVSEFVVTLPRQMFANEGGRA